eukprot:EC723540.1.p2 GENE.EC723540.1~~EC723540.1.p2  ORF type:complete len:97 (+),score=25.20 EC723540.1:287-577(+)
MKRERAQETNVTKLVKSSTTDEKQVKEKIAKLKARQEAVTNLEATARTLLSTNALYLGVTYLLGFYFLTTLPVLPNMLLTGVATNAVLFYVARKAK